jgi:hypothetical protein
MTEDQPIDENNIFYAGRTSRGTYKVVILAEFESDDEVGFTASSPFMNTEIALSFDNVLGDTVGRTALEAWNGVRGIATTGTVNILTGAGTVGIPARPV